MYYYKKNGFAALYAKVKSIFRPAQSILSETRSSKDSNASAESIWDNSIEQYQKGDFKVYWELLPEVSKYQLKCMTGDENMHYFEYAVNLAIKTAGKQKLKGLSIGCSEGNPGVEMVMMESGIFDVITVMDIAGGLLSKQQAIATQRGLNSIKYVKQDLNEVILEKNTYDFIWAVGTVHHINRLENLFEQINEALKPQGVFFMREYIGPNYLQFTNLQLSIVNQILDVLPSKYKKTNEGLLKERKERVDLGVLKSWDPSESIRSQDILAVMNERLDTIHLAFTGGTILHPLLDGIASNFERDEDARALLRVLILFERILVEKSVLSSDYVFCIAGKKASDEPVQS